MHSRLLFLVNALESDGPTSAMLSLAQQAQIRGWDVQFASLQRGGHYAATIKKTLGTEAICLGSGSSYLAGLRGRNQLGHRLQSPTMPSTTVVAALAAPTLAALSLHRIVLLRHRVIAVHHGAHEWNERGPMVGAVVHRLMNHWLPRTHYHFAVSPHTAHELVEKTHGRISCNVLGNIVSDTLPAGPFVPRGLPTNPTEPWRFGGCGRLVPLKNWSTALGAVHLLLQRGYRIQLEIFGEGPERTSLLALAQRLDITSAVSFLGHNPNWLDHASSWHAVVHPSRMESFGLAPAQAAHIGLPIIFSSAGALPWTLEGCGICYGSAEDEQSLATAMMALAQQLETESNSPEQPMRRRQRIQQSHGPDAVWKRFEGSLPDPGQSAVQP
jgi:glycosyltransferase involved in cell wall biosynthesis